MAADSLQLFQKIEKEIQLDRMVRHVEQIGHWHRYTGTPQGEAFVDDLTGRLSSLGIPWTVEEYEALTSLPQIACLTLESGEGLRLIGDVYSAEAEALRCELIYDADSRRKNLSAHEELARFASFRGKLVLSHASGGEFAEKVFQAGGKGLIHINSSPGGYIHHSNISAVWGTPCRSSPCFLECIPSAGISLEDGEALIRKLEAGRLFASLSVKMDCQVRRSRMPIVDIPGRQKTFVLLNGHYDSWYEGITDNAGSDAILLELAQALWKHRRHLERGVRIAWWSGHSDARYAGSAWYCDQHWAELNERCVASVNLDLTGCKLAKQIRTRTTCMERERLTADLIREFTGMTAKSYIPMIRGGDQSFWGARIPISIMFKYEPLDEERVSPCPSGGPWWHTDQDTLDKLDPAILLRDAKINGKLVCLLANSRALPVELAAYTEKMEEFLETIQAELSEEFSLTAVLNAVRALRPWCQRLDRLLTQSRVSDCDEICKRIAGELTRLTYSAGSPYQQDPSTPYPPFGILAKAAHVRRDNTPAALLVFQKTEFQRACNRLCGQLGELQREARQYLDAHEEN